MFNEEQLAVINELHKNIFLVAPAGTGKTNTLSERIVNILNKDLAKPSEILCLTFTNKSCREMKERIESKVGLEAAKITIKTFHSFCLQVIREYAKKKTDIFSDFIVYDEDDCRDIIKRANFARVGDKVHTGLDIYLLQRFINAVKEARIRYNIFTDNERADFKKTIDILKKEESSKFREIFKIKYGHYDLNLKSLMEQVGYNNVYIYNKVLINNRALDFNDLTTEAKNLFKDEAIRNDFKDRYKFINIDEMQDTSLVEYEIIENLFGSNNILLSGDKFQTIYGWRGSEPTKIFERFFKKNPRVIVFNKNYRSTKILTDASMEYLKNSFGEDVENTYKKGVLAESIINGEKIKLYECRNIENEAKVIFNSFNKLAEKGELTTACVLTRTNTYNIELSKALSMLNKKEKFEFVLVDDFKFFRRSEIKDITAFFKYLVNNNDSVSLKRILLNLKTNIGKETLDKIDSSEYRKVGVKLTDYLSENSSMGEFYSPLLKAYDEENIIVFDVESTGKDVTEDEIIQIAAIKINKEGKIIDSFERFIKPNKSVGSSFNVHGFSDEYLKNNGEDKTIVFNDFLDYIENAVVVGHNVNYDISIFSSELSRLNLESPKFKAYFDTLDIYRRFHPNELNHKLEYLSSKFGTNHKPSHNAMDDIIATAELLVRAIKDDIKDSTLERINYIGKHYKSFESVRAKFKDLDSFSQSHRPFELIDEIEKNFNITGRYKDEERKARKDRILELSYVLKELDIKEKSPKDSLIDIVNFTSLSNGEMEELMVKRTGKIRIPIITIHQAKGLEFADVFIAGLNDGLFPLGKSDFDEEKKLFYVAITRAKRTLALSYTTKNSWGNICYESSLISYISNERLERIGSYEMV